MPPKELPGQVLASKDATLFRQLVKFYEGKQYKKGIKAADQILKKNPEHGETLAMKGLIVNCMSDERKEEAFDLVRKGLKHNLKSHVCWHVYGLLYRSHSEYDEAVKCYKNALRMEPESIQVLRDLAGLQIQLRDIAGFVETRHQLFLLKPGNRSNWISYAVAHHLAKNYELAVQVLDAYEKSQQDGDEPASEGYERSELVLYKVSVLAEGGKHTEALALLDASKDKIQDTLGARELKAELLLQGGRAAEAQGLYWELVGTNPDNSRYHAALRSTFGLPADAAAGVPDDATRARLSALYKDIQQAHPKSSAAFRIPLDFEVGDAFTAAADAYVRRFLQKGIPSLFMDLKSLYSDAAKAEALGALFERLLSALESDGAFPPLLGSTEAEAPAAPQAQLWTMVYLAQHYDRIGDTGRALETLARCTEHTPTLAELYTVKAKILKHAGDVEGAAAAANRARSMDLADRFLNSTAAKWKFRAGDVEGAEATAALFTKDGEQVNNLFDMQCTWYEIEAGRAWLRRGDFGKALKNFLAVSKHFFDIQEDQFDFHSYCIRKMTLRSYIEMLRMEDSLYSAVSYVRAAYGAIQTYVRLHDRPASSEQDESDRVAAMSADERRKHKQQQRKEAAKAKKREDEARAKEAAAAEAAAKEKAAAKKPAAAKRKADLDPDGKQLAATTNPLGEATKLLEKLKQHADARMDTQLWAFEVYLRKGKLLLALSAVKRALAIGGPAHPVAHCLVVRFALRAQAQDDAATAAPGVVRQVVSAQLEQILSGASLPDYQAAFLQQHAKSSLLHLAAAAETGALLEPSQKEASAQLILSGTEAGAVPLAHDDCITVHKLLLEELEAASAAETWKQRCRECFAWSEYFDGQKRLPLEEPVAPPAKAETTNGLENGVSGLKLKE